MQDTKPAKSSKSSKSSVGSTSPKSTSASASKKRTPSEEHALFAEMITLENELHRYSADPRVMASKEYMDAERRVEQIKRMLGMR